MRYLILFLLFLINHQIKAQFEVETSLQLLLYGQKNQYGIVPAGNEGVVFFNEIKNLESTSKRKWQIINLDPDLEIKWRSYFESDYNFKISQVKYQDGFIYLMFSDTNIPVKSLFFARSSIAENKFEFFAIEDFLPNQVVGFEILGNSLFLIGADENRPSILKFRFGDGRPYVLKGLYGDDNDFLDIDVLPDQHLIQIVTRMKKQHKKSHILVVKQFDEHGQVHKDFIIESKKGYDLLNAKVQSDADGAICVVGTYSYGKTKLSNGMFTMVYDGNEEQSIYYYDYVNLHNFFEYLPEKEKEKVERKYKKNEARLNKSTYKINQLPRKIMKVGDDWLYTGEFVNVFNQNSAIYGRMSVEYRQYSHAIFLGIGSNGRLKWDNSMSMNDLITPSFRQQVFVSEYGDHTITYYLHGLNFVYKVIDGGEDIMTNGDVGLDIPGVEEVKPNYNNYGEILPWYDNKFIAFGSFQEDRMLGETKNYFYINKISISNKAELN